MSDGDSLAAHGYGRSDSRAARMRRIAAEFTGLSPLGTLRLWCHFTRCRQMRYYGSASGPRPAAGRDGGMDYESIFQTAIETLKAEGRYRIFAELERHAGAFPRAAHHGIEGAPDVTV